MEPTEQKINIENEITSLKRELKLVSAQLYNAKQELIDINSLKEKNNCIIEEQEVHLQDVLNEISDLKLKWVQEKSIQEEEIAKQFSDAQNILNRKAELNQQEELIRTIEAKNTESVNELRRLEIKLQNDGLILEAKKRELEEKQKTLEIQKEQNTKDKEEFKGQILKVLKQVEKI